MVDRYTKIALTIIAIALSALAWQGFQPQPAQAQFGAGACGTRLEPCFITLTDAPCGASFNPCFIEFDRGPLNTKALPIEIRN